MVNLFLFPGQGAQFAGMGASLLAASSRAAERLARISEALGCDFGRIMAEGSEEELKSTAVSQPAITLVSLTASELLEERGVVPSAVAGFSLGEFSALAAAGVLDSDAALDLVTRRGQIMDRVCRKLAASGAASGMAAVIGLSPEAVEKIAAEHEDLYAVNLNSPRQTVVAGTAAALEKAEALFKEQGAKRFIPLKVAGPFHSPLMAEAAAEFEEAVKAFTWVDPRIPLFSNVTGNRVTTGVEAAGLSVQQMVSPVRWTRIEEGLLKLNPSRCLEVGPGKVLAGLWKAVSRDIPCLAAGEESDIKNINNHEGEVSHG